MAKEFAGIFTPLITPISEDGSPDLPSTERLVDFQLKHGVHGFWVMGTSAEFASFTASERAATVATLVARVAGRVPTIVNISDASTRAAIVHGKAALEAGADAVAATPPYYYPHSQDELLDHYRRIRAAIDLPLFIYNIPQTVKVRVDLGTAASLASEGTVAGVKDSQNDLEWLRALVRLTAGTTTGFSAFAGTRYLIDAAVVAGACGAIPSVANAFPDLAVQAYSSAVAGDFSRAAACENKIMDLEALALAFPGGSRNAVILAFLKTVLHHQGVVSNPALTAPLRSFSPEERESLMAGVRNVLEA